MKWILAVVATEALVEILIHGYPFEWLRKLAKKTTFTGELFSCGWCLSVWIAAGVFIVVYLGFAIVLVPLVIHRLSNYLHYIYGILRRIRWNGKG